MPFLTERFLWYGINPCQRKNNKKKLYYLAIQSVETFDTVWIILLSYVPETSQWSVTVPTTEMLHVPCLVLCLGILTCKNNLNRMRNNNVKACDVLETSQWSITVPAAEMLHLPCLVLCLGILTCKNNL